MSNVVGFVGSEENLGQNSTAIGRADCRYTLDDHDFVIGVVERKHGTSNQVGTCAVGIGVGIEDGEVVAWWAGESDWNVFHSINKSARCIAGTQGVDEVAILWH